MLKRDDFVFRVRVCMSFGFYCDCIVESLTIERAIARAVDFAMKAHPDSKFWLAEKAERIESGVIVGELL